MTSETELSVYCIVNVASPPVALTRRKETGAFYYHLPVPIQDQLVIFCEGNWNPASSEYTVTVTYKDDEIELGKITNSSRCLFWKRGGTTIPESMSNEDEKGLAKLVVEMSEEPIQVENMEITTNTKTDLRLVNENTPQLTEETENTPERPQKKRKTSLTNKDEKTPTGQASKKLKTKKVPTRLRTPNDDKKTKSKEESPKNEKKSDKSTNKYTKGKQKASLSESDAKADKKDQKSHEKDISSEGDQKSNNVKKADQSSENLSEELSPSVSKGMKTGKGSGGKQGKLTPWLNTEQNINNENNDVGKKQNEKNVRKKSETKKKMDTSQSEETEGKTKRTRKKKDNQNDSINEDSENNDSNDNKLTNIDKENVQVDGNIPSVHTDQKSESEERIPVKESKSSFTISTTGKAATCKDLTLRALDRPTGRWGHSLCFVNRNLSVLIGGQGEKQQISKDSVWALDCETRRWKDPPTVAEGQKPEYRMGHTASYDPLVRCIYVYGGSKNTRWFHDVHILDIEEWKWQIVKVNGKAPTRAYHSATLYRHELWIFGGVYPRPDPQPDGCSNEVHIFSPVMESWYSPIVSGEKPIPRSGHSATLINDQLVVFGGWDAPISYNDLHVLDMSIVEWSQPNVTGSPPSPRSWHASCALSGNRLLIHGGYNGDFALEDTHIFNLDDLSWIRIHVENPPSARVGHKALCMPYRHDNEEEDEVIIFGGGDNDGAYFCDLYSIYVPFQPATLS
ncbi:ras guanine nucleotide exchange factor F-like [Ruditapes philippinarum]|uniref:ras guanine nucleotide exchange factor F-like n=1 Tax=Ruditapes philippinarum TaxID=129788 RepID=UPI00295B987D|nr:ras guanine nucleotide exchange factor F-like [Ruditapes philippinarum]